jgi:AraC-like DNA-binding protein
LQTEIITVPIVVCTKFLNPEFIRTGVHKGLDHFILCSMPHRQINSKIIEAIQQNDFRLFLENEANPDVYTPYTQDIITEILSTSPNQLKISSLAEKLGISVRWTQSLIQRIFNRSFTQLKRKLIVLQALNLMKNTRLDNIEIALMLGYRHESSLFKAFQKELGYPPSQARENLSKANPQKLLK